jgi:hypothetical protein
VVALGLGYLVATPLRQLPVIEFAIGFFAIAAITMTVGVTVPYFPRRAGIALLLPLAAVIAIGAWGREGYNLAGAAAVTLSLLIGGSMVGSIVGARIAHPGHLLVVAYVSTLADLYSVFHSAGLSAIVVQDQRLLPLLALPWAMAGDAGTVDLVPVLGIGDVIMISLYLVVARRHGIPPWRFALGFFFAFAFVFALLLLAGQAVPVLPFLGIAVCLAHPSVRQLRPQDRRQAFLGMAILTAAVGGLFLLEAFA